MVEEELTEEAKTRLAIARKISKDRYTQLP